MQRIVKRREPGIIEVEVWPTLVVEDGPFRVTLEVDEDGDWCARLVDADAGKRTIRFLPLGIGATREAALAHLSICIYNALMDDTHEPPHD